MEVLVRALRDAATSRRGRLFLLIAVCGAVSGIEAGIVRDVIGLTGTVHISPQASALWPYGTFHDLRWVMVYHHTWIEFVGFSLAAIILRGLFCTVLTFLAWPSYVPRPPLPRLLGRNVVFAAVVGAALSPWAALSIVVADVSLTWYLLGEILPLLILAPFFQSGGIAPGWWRGLPPSGTVVLSVLNFILLTAGSSLVSFVPDGWSVATAAVAGAFNGLFWNSAVRTTLAKPHTRWRRVPVTPVVFTVVIGLLFAVGNISQLGVEKPRQPEPPALAQVEDQVMDQPVIYLAGYNSQYDGETSGFTPPIIRYSYTGLGPNGRPKPYRPVATHQSLVASAHLLATQIDKVHNSTGKRVSLFAESEGSLITRYYLTTMPHPNVDMVVLLSPVLRGGRIYYPPRDASSGWGIVTGWQLRGIFATLGVASQLPNSADEPFIRSFMDNAPLFRGKQLLCPIKGVRLVAFVPTFDAAANPPGLHPDIPVVEVPGLHGVLIDNGGTRRRVVEFLKRGRVRREGRWDYLALQNAGAAWQAPALKLQLNPAWSTAAGKSTRDYKGEKCLLH